MTDEQWRQIWSLYESACHQPADRRRAYLDSVAADPELVRKVVQMLETPDESPTEPLSRVGTKVGRYMVMEELGRGGMGEVYAGRDTELERVVALKFLAPASEGARSAVERFIREAKAASALNHPNIVTVHDVIRVESTLAMVMEKVEGMALRGLCGTPLPADRVIHIGQQAARALAAAHAQGLVHRDVKPENIMVRPDGYVKVLDFGLARLTASGDRTSTAGLAVGTLRYMSPEQSRGESLSAASDVFSLGLVLYELVAGVHPFAAASPFETVHAIATQEPEHPSWLKEEVPPPLESLIFSMLAKDPSARPSSEEVARKLAEIRSPSAVRANKASRLWAVLAACLAVAGAIGWLLFERVGPRDVTDLRMHPLTSQPGWEAFPALSPDGESVAFCWTDSPDRARQIYVKRRGDDIPYQLTDSETEGNIGPLVWSPDGSHIAFKRLQGRPGAIYSIAKEGGAQTKILDLAVADLSSTIDWSPDGIQLAFSDADPASTSISIYLFNLQTGEKRKLTAPPPGDWGDWDPRFSPDGQTIAFKRVRGFLVDDVYLVPVAGGAIRRLTNDWRGIWGHAWMPDGKSLVVSCQRGGSVFGLWQVPLAGQHEAQRITQGGVDAITPATARKASRMVWVNQEEDFNIYRVAATGIGAPTRLVASTVRDYSAVYSPDGRMAFSSDRTGSEEIWIARADGSNQIRVTNFNGPATDNPRWSPDGRGLAFESQRLGRSTILVMECDPVVMRCGKPTRLTADTASEFLCGWSADGQFVYFASEQTGRFEVWKRPAAGGPAVQVTANGGQTAYESNDGKWLYISKHQAGSNSIWRIPGPKMNNQGSSAEELLIGPGYKVAHESWTLAPGQIFFVDRAVNMRSATIRAYDLATKQVRQILFLGDLLPEKVTTELSVSPDSKWLLYSRLDKSGSNIMVADLR